MPKGEVKTLLIKPIEHNDPTPSPNFDFSVFKAEEDDVEEIPDEITRLLEHEEKIIQPHLENLEIVNLGSEDCIREVKIWELLEESVKKGLIELLREYVDVFAWSYEDMPGHIGPKSLNLKKYPTSNAHNFFIENPNYAKFESKLIILKRFTTLMWRFFHLKLASCKQRGLNGLAFGENFQR
ncbi:hypothetical protein KIW84_041688 [Lathyrus oleraceus]|uniref:Uncharacterized protein n=1 Tax=Pisum sativum TaxID=3888 RepID=A0A9D4XDM0_PEA|nr:hypothetical protein KIW84_041688 [Pisum sativum]